MRTIELSPKQCEFISNATHRYNGKIGATQCGKTFIDIAYVIPNRIFERRGKPGLFLILGVTKETIERNVLEPMRDFWGSGLVGEINSRNIARLFGEKVYCLGAEKITQVTKLRGAKIKYAYCDELVDLNHEVFELLKSRLSLSYSVCDFTGNPSYPNHYVKKFIDSDADIYCQHWTIDDNPFLDPGRVAEMKREYAGTVYYDRYILGRWQRAEGAIYHVFADNEKEFYTVYDRQNRCFWVDGKPKYLDSINVGIDWGGNRSAHAFVATGITRDYESLFILKSERHKAEGTTPEDVCRWALDFIGKVESAYGAIDDIYADSAEQLLINLLRQKTSISVRNSLKTPIIDRIRFVVSLMAQRRLFLTSECETVAEFFRDASYDPKAQDDRRLDDGSYDQDSGDAFEYSIERFMPYIIRE